MPSVKKYNKIIKKMKIKKGKGQRVGWLPGHPFVG
jgi:hypothetical protein